MKDWAWWLTVGSICVSGIGGAAFVAGFGFTAGQQAASIQAVIDSHPKAATLFGLDTAGKGLGSDAARELAAAGTRMAESIDGFRVRRIEFTYVEDDGKIEPVGQ